MGDIRGDSVCFDGGCQINHSVVLSCSGDVLMAIDGKGLPLLYCIHEWLNWILCFLSASGKVEFQIDWSLPCGWMKFTNKANCENHKLFPYASKHEIQILVVPIFNDIWYDMFMC